MVNPVEFVFLAEFDIDEGSILKHSYPESTGVDEHLLAEHMLPDGAHDRNEDWTIFYLNQIPGLTINTSRGSSSNTTNTPSNDYNEDKLASMGINESGSGEKSERLDNNRKGKQKGEGELLYVMSLVRTKMVATVRRGAVVKALAVATRSPYVQIYKPILLLALDDYYNDPSIGSLIRFYNAANSMDLTHLPYLSLNERLILRSTDRKDMFEEKFFEPQLSSTNNNNSNQSNTPIRRDSPIPSILSKSTSKSIQDDSSEILGNHRRSISSGSISSKLLKDLRNNDSTEDVPSWRSNKSRSNTVSSVEGGIGIGTAGNSWIGGNKSETDSGTVRRLSKDTHSFDTQILYNGITLPIRIPLGTFPEEIGDYSLIKLIQTFSTPTTLSPLGPFHPHLHTNGPSTHPIILLFNALVTNKRIVFLGHGLPANDVANLVLAACALGSGGGTVLSGFVERTFPYTNLTNLDGLQTVDGFIAGVCNPAFANRPSWWDVLCNIETGKIIISKELTVTPLTLRNINLTPLNLNRSTTVASIDESGGIGSSRAGGGGGGINVGDTKAESADNYFMEEITSAIQSHYGESVIRSRFTDYVQRFIRLTSLYEEEYLGSTSIGFQTYSYTESNPTKLGSGIYFTDEVTKMRELGASLGRIEGWRQTRSYEIFKEEFQSSQKESLLSSSSSSNQISSSNNFDLLHQIARLRQSRRMTTGEVELILKTLVLECKKNDEEGLLRILAFLPPHFGGLLPITFGLFHPSNNVRKYTLEFLDILNQSETGKKFLKSLNTFHRSAYSRQSKESLSQSFNSNNNRHTTTTSPNSPPPPPSGPSFTNQVDRGRRPSLGVS